MKKNVTMLIILDGFGNNPEKNGNAISCASKPNIDKLMSTCPTAQIYASGEDVGLPDGQMGNSEVGHTNIGAGRIVYQELTRITKSIEEGDFFSIPEFSNAIEKCKEKHGKLHFMGLLSDGGVHSHQRHLYALLELAKRKGFDEVYIHCFMDGRDTLPASGEGYIQKLEEIIKEKNVGRIATIMGRFYAMDRDNRWKRIQKAYNAMVFGEGTKSNSPIHAIESSYQKEIFDEFVEPIVLVNGESPVATIDDGDSVIFYNFRPDRAREITKSLVEKEFDKFPTKKMKINFVAMTEYDKSIKNVNVAFKPEKLTNTFGEYISKKGMKQLRIAETEKYAHVTFFFNGGREEAYEGEERVLVPSPKVETYDLKPEMSAYEVTENVIKAIESEEFDSIILNFANPDMVGHTGNISATEKAIETVDECVGKIINSLEEHNGICLITADHGNAEQMIDYKIGEPFTSHTTNPVPIILFGMENVQLENGKLCDLAPTLLDMMSLRKPKEMTGKSLLIRN